MTRQPALPGLASDASLRAYAVAEYRELYGADADSATIGVEVMAEKYGGLDAALDELRRRAAQAVCIDHQQTQRRRVAAAGRDRKKNGRGRITVPGLFFIPAPM